MATGKLYVYLYWPGRARFLFWLARVFARTAGRLTAAAARRVVVIPSHDPRSGRA